MCLDNYLPSDLIKTKLQSKVQVYTSLLHLEGLDLQMRVYNPHCRVKYRMRNRILQQIYKNIREKNKRETFYSANCNYIRNKVVCHKVVNNIRMTVQV